MVPLFPQVFAPHVPHLLNTTGAQAEVARQQLNEDEINIINGLLSETRTAK